jgi:hypothetical protein
MSEKEGVLLSSFFQKTSSGPPLSEIDSLFKGVSATLNRLPGMNYPFALSAICLASAIAP